MGFFKSIGKFFSKAVKSVSKVVNKIPIIGNLVSSVLPAPLKTVVKAATAVGNTVAKVTSAISDVASIINPDKGGLPTPLPEVYEQARGGEPMGLPAVVGQVAQALVPTAQKLLGVTGITGRRRRRRGGISMTEMGKIMFLSQVVGKKSPAVTWAVMKSIGGKI